MKNVTRKDIAEKLGVSVSVVSRVINNSGYVSKENIGNCIEDFDKILQYKKKQSWDYYNSIIKRGKYDKD